MAKAGAALLFLVVIPVGIAVLLSSRQDAPLPHPALSWHRAAELSPEDSSIFTAPAPPLQGPWKHNSILHDQAAKLFASKVHGAETVTPGPGTKSVTMVDSRGYVWVADAPGTGNTGVKGSDPAGDSKQSGAYVLRSEPLAYVGPGRVLGLQYDAEGNLLACDCVKGLIMLQGAAQAARAQAQGHPISPLATRLVVLANRVSPSSRLDPGSPIVYADDLDIAPDGKVYFSDAQTIPTSIDAHGLYDPMHSAALGLLSGAPSGRLLCYDPSDGTTTVLATGLWFSNGVAVSADGSFAAVAETNRMRVTRYWLTGAKAGTMDTLIDHLPGFPDGVSRASDGNFWVAIVAPRLSILPLLRHRALRTVVAWLPSFVRPAPQRQGLVLKVSPEGQLLASFWDVQGSNVALTTSAQEHDGQLWMGQLEGAGVWSLRLP